MTLDELRRFAEQHPDGALVTVPKAALLEACGSVVFASPAQTGVDLTVAEVAARMKRGESTVRTWLERGDLPGAYKLHDREWRIPPAAIEAMQRAQAKRHRVPTPQRTTDISEWRLHLPKSAP